MIQKFVRFFSSVPKDQAFKIYKKKFDKNIVKVKKDNNMKIKQDSYLISKYIDNFYERFHQNKKYLIHYKK
mgnify:CR=1 FL=1